MSRPDYDVKSKLDRIHEILSDEDGFLAKKFTRESLAAWLDDPTGSTTGSIATSSTPVEFLLHPTELRFLLETETVEMMCRALKCSVVDVTCEILPPLQREAARNDPDLRDVSVVLEGETHVRPSSSQTSLTRWRLMRLILMLTASLGAYPNANVPTGESTVDAVLWEMRGSSARVTKGEEEEAEFATGRKSRLLDMMRRAVIVFGWHCEEATDTYVEGLLLNAGRLLNDRVMELMRILPVVYVDAYSLTSILTGIGNPNSIDLELWRSASFRRTWNVSYFPLHETLKVQKSCSPPVFERNEIARTFCRAWIVEVRKTTNRDIKKTHLFMQRNRVLIDDFVFDSEDLIKLMDVLEERTEPPGMRNATHLATRSDYAEGRVARDMVMHHRKKGTHYHRLRPEYLTSKERAGSSSSSSTTTTARPKRARDATEEMIGMSPLLKAALQEENDDGTYAEYTAVVHTSKSRAVVDPPLPPPSKPKRLRDIAPDCDKCLAHEPCEVATCDVVKGKTKAKNGDGVVEFSCRPNCFHICKYHRTFLEVKDYPNGIMDKRLHLRDGRIVRAVKLNNKTFNVTDAEGNSVTFDTLGALVDTGGQIPYLEGLPAVSLKMWIDDVSNTFTIGTAEVLEKYGPFPCNALVPIVESGFVPVRGGTKRIVGRTVDHSFLLELNVSGKYLVVKERGKAPITTDFLSTSVRLYACWKNAVFYEKVVDVPDYYIACVSNATTKDKYQFATMTFETTTVGGEEEEERQ